MLRVFRSLKFPYSEGIFETFPFRNGKLEFFSEHWKRLKGSCQALRYPLLSDPADIESQILKLCRDDRLEHAVVRLIASKNQMPILRLQLLPLPKPLVSVKLIHTKIAPHPLARHKITQRKNYDALRNKALEEKAFDTLFISPEDDVLETARTNIFIVSKGKLYTPEADGRILRGIIRDQIIKIAEKLEIPLQEKRISVDELRNADEIFITNSLRGALQVTRIAGLWTQSAPPKLTLLLTGTLPVNKMLNNP